MAAFIILFLSCIVLAVGGYLQRRVDWQAIEDENKRYYTPNGYHVYYDRKILRHLHEEAEIPQERTTEN